MSQASNNKEIQGHIIGKRIYRHQILSVGPFKLTFFDTHSLEGKVRISNSSTPLSIPKCMLCKIYGILIHLFGIFCFPN